MEDLYNRINAPTSASSTSNSASKPELNLDFRAEALQIERA
jgi:hypothetical protein